MRKTNNVSWLYHAHQLGWLEALKNSEILSLEAALSAEREKVERLRKALKPLIENIELLVRMLICQSTMLGMEDTAQSPLISEVRNAILEARAALDDAAP